ncbi:MAG: AbrB/MazE/SpoVT family DNA-binding domain-containing protein [Undibacterium sp.]|nr:AbrB/MazE/SpoVT family DNA-binding domain-containing protein [Opitutaceae bacterium]
MVINAKGQVTIPRQTRERDGLTPGNTVEFSVERDGIVLRPIKATDTTLVDAWLRQTTGAARDKFTTAKLMKLTRR